MISWKCLTWTFYIKWKEGERELTSGKTESVYKETDSVWHQYNVQREIEMEIIEWKFQALRDMMLTKDIASRITKMF